MLLQASLFSGERAAGVVKLPPIRLDGEERDVHRPLWTGIWRKGGAAEIAALGALIAVQFMDVRWSVLVFLGIEKVRIVPGLTEKSALDLYYMPYTHSLGGALLLSGLYGGAVALFFRQQRPRIFLVAALAVFSHWILDLLVYVPNLPLWDNSMKVGFGLWRHLWISLPLELATLLAGAFLYVRCIPARGKGNIVFWIFILALAALQMYVSFVPPPADAAAEARTALTAYGVIALAAAFVERMRAQPRKRRLWGL